jgi:hypothetical protein
MVFDDPAFWRAGAISTITVMTIVLIMLTIDSLAAISPGGSHVPPLHRHQPVWIMPRSFWASTMCVLSSAPVGRADFDALFRRPAEILIRKGGRRRRLDHDCRVIVTPMANVARLG